MNYDDLARGVVEWTNRSGQSHRIVSIDLETKVLSPSDFLTGETILSFAMARRMNGNVESKLFMLKDETPQSQQALFAEVNQEIERTRPLIVLGYNITGYDFPLLRINLRNSPIPHWALIDMVERAFVLDMKHPLKFELAKADGVSPKVRTLEDVISHPKFAHMPLSRTKNLLNGLEKAQKGERIYSIWSKDRKSFEKYAVGDVVDVLLLFEELFQTREAVVSARAE